MDKKTKKNSSPKKQVKKENVTKKDSSLNEQVKDEKVTKKDSSQEKNVKENKKEEIKTTKVAEKKKDHKKVQRASGVIQVLDENRRVIYGFVAGLLIGLGIMIIFMPERIAELEDGTQPVASIDGKVFTADELYEDMKDYYSVSLLLDNIDRTILEEMYPTDDEMMTSVRETADSYIAQYEQYGYTEEQFLSGNGFANYDEFVEYLTLDYRRNLYFDDAVKDSITDDEINYYYEDEVFGDIDSKHILIPTGNDGDLSDEDAKALAEEIIGKLNNGATFDEVKDEYEDQITYEELGYQAFNASLEDAYMDALKELDNDTYTKEPVQTSYGYHIIYRIDQKEKPSLDDVKDSVIEVLASEKKADDANLLYKLLIQLRKDNGLEFNDTVMKSKYDSYCKNYE